MLVYRYLKTKTKNDDRILDVGTKDGKYLNDFHGLVVGLDIELNPKNNNIEYMLGDGRSLPFRTNSFDFVVSNQVLEHIREKELLVQEMARVCKPSGSVLISFPNRLFPGNPHDLPPFFSLLPRKIGKNLSRIVLSKSQSKYYENHVFNISPIRGKNLFKKNFEEVTYVTTLLVQENKDIYKGSLLGKLFLFLWPLVIPLMQFRIGKLLFEYLFGYSAYLCTQPRRTNTDT